MKINVILFLFLLFITSCDINSPKIFDNGPLTTLIYSYDIKDKKLDKIADALNPIYYPIINSFVYIQNKGGLTLIDAETKKLKVIAPVPDIWDFAISKDGSKFTFCSYSNSNTDLYLVNADGTNQNKIISTQERLESRPSFSPSGRFVVYDFSKDNFTTTGIAVYDIVSSQERIIKEVKSPIGVSRANFIYDDKTILYIESEKGLYDTIKYKLKMINFNDLPNENIIFNGVYGYTLSPNNKILFPNTVTTEGSNFFTYHLFLYDIATQQLIDLGVGNASSFSMDGEYLLSLESDHLKKDIIHKIKLSDYSEESFVFEGMDFMITQPFLSKDNTKIYFSARPNKSKTN